MKRKQTGKKLTEKGRCEKGKIVIVLVIGTIIGKTDGIVTQKGGIAFRKNGVCHVHREIRSTLGGLVSSPNIPDSPEMSRQEGARLMVGTKRGMGSRRREVAAVIQERTTMINKTDPRSLFRQTYVIFSVRLSSLRKRKESSQKTKPFSPCQSATQDICMMSEWYTWAVEMDHGVSGWSGVLWGSRKPVFYYLPDKKIKMYSWSFSF